MNYLDYGLRIGALSGKLMADFPWQTMLPGAIEYAENRIYRELDPIDTMRSAAGTLTASTRVFTLPVPAQGRFVVVTAINLTASPYTSLVPVSMEYINAVWPMNVTGDPSVWAPFTSTQVYVAPAASTSLSVTVMGEIRPTALSQTNRTTMLTDYLPDLFIAASMVFLSGNGPAMATWEGEYQKLFASANTVTNRQKWRAEAWSSQQPATIASPPREGS